MRLEPAALGVVCGYELAALLARSDRVPTITALVRRLPRPLRGVVGAASALWVLLHFDDETARWFMRAWKQRLRLVSARD